MSEVAAFGSPAPSSYCLAFHKADLYPGGEPLFLGVSDHPPDSLQRTVLSNTYFPWETHTHHCILLKRKSVFISQFCHTDSRVRDTCSATHIVRLSPSPLVTSASTDGSCRSTSICVAPHSPLPLYGYNKLEKHL